jgi:triosephosphate isomerase
MYKTTAEAVTFARDFTDAPGAVGTGIVGTGIVGTGIVGTGAEVAVCAPFTQLEALKREFAGTGIRLGAQNMHFEEEGAFTGEISAAMLAEIGVDYCIIGHSERRQYFAETDATVNKKLHQAVLHGITPIFCVGEVLEQRDAGEEYEVVRRQIEAGLDGLPAEEIRHFVIAYEPVWAIGTGRNATAEQAEEMCAYIRSVAAGLYGQETADHIRIQYGGSVKPENAAEILGMPNVDGALVGGASLLPDKFLAVCGGSCAAGQTG